MRLALRLFSALCASLIAGTVGLNKSASAQTSLSSKDVSSVVEEHPASAALRLSEADQKIVDQAIEGLPGAQSLVGMMYVNGQVLPRDFTQAAAWFKMAADQGNVDATYNLGMLYLNGLGVAPNEVEGSRLVKEAALKGQSSAQLVMGILSTTGVAGSPSDDTEALAWMEVAARSGSVEAAAFVDLMVPELADTVLESAAVRAMRLHEAVEAALSRDKP